MKSRFFCPPLVALLFAAFGTTIFAQSGPASHLLLLDTSFSMGRKKAQTALLVQRAVESGFGGSLSEGEKFSVWTFNQQVNPRSFPDQTWSAVDAPLQAELILRYLRTQTHTGVGQPRQALASAIEATRSLPQARIFIITDDRAKFVGGAPFGALAQFEDFYRAQIKADRKPVLSTLALAGGELKAWSVDQGGPFIVPVFGDDIAQPTPTAPVATAPAPVLRHPTLKVTDSIGTNVIRVQPAQSIAAVPADLQPKGESSVEPKVEPQTKAEPPVQPQLEAKAEPPVQQKVELESRSPAAQKFESPVEPTAAASAAVDQITRSNTVREELPIAIPIGTVSADSPPHRKESVPLNVVVAETNSIAQTANDGASGTGDESESPAIAAEGELENAADSAAVRPVALQGQALPPSNGAGIKRVTLAILGGLVVFAAIIVIARRKAPRKSSSLISQTIHTKER